MGRLEVARLNLAAMVREGVDAGTLNIAVGHVPSTALPDQPGNFAIAAHRDDVELLVGGTMARMAARGYRTGILDLTAGEKGTDGSAQLRGEESEERMICFWLV